MTTIEERKATILTEADIVPIRLSPSGPTVLGVEIPATVDCPESDDDYPAAPAGFTFGEGLILDGVEIIEVLHLCGARAEIERAWA